MFVPVLFDPVHQINVCYLKQLDTVLSSKQYSITNISQSTLRFVDIAMFQSVVPDVFSLRNVIAAWCNEKSTNAVTEITQQKIIIMFFNDINDSVRFIDDKIVEYR